jgi:hypothetical protein
LKEFPEQVIEDENKGEKLSDEVVVKAEHKSPLKRKFNEFASITDLGKGAFPISTGI